MLFLLMAGVGGISGDGAFTRNPVDDGQTEQLTQRLQGLGGFKHRRIAVPL
jgi:hypothetical protein